MLNQVNGSPIDGSSLAVSRSKGRNSSSQISDLGSDLIRQLISHLNSTENLCLVNKCFRNAICEVKTKANLHLEYLPPLLTYNEVTRLISESPSKIDLYCKECFRRCSYLKRPQKKLEIRWEQKKIEGHTFHQTAKIGYLQCSEHDILGNSTTTLSDIDPEFAVPRKNWPPVDFPSVKNFPRLDSLSLIIDKWVVNRVFRPALYDIPTYSGLKNLEIEGPISEEGSNLLHVKLAKLQSLSLTNSSFITDGGLRDCLSLSQMTYLKLTGSRVSSLVNDDGKNILDSYPVATTLPNLTTLDLSENKQLLDQGVINVLRITPNLQNLILVGCRKLTGTLLSEVIFSRIPLLRLDCERCENFASNILPYLIYCKSTLRNLNLIGTKIITFVNANSKIELTKLSLSDWSKSSKSSSKNLIEKTSPSLIELNLNYRGNFYFENHSNPVFPKLRKCILKKLDLTRPVSISPHSPLDLFANTSALEECSLWGVDFSATGVMRAEKSWLNLKSIEIADSNLFSQPQVFRLLLNVLKNVQSISLAFNHKDSMSILREIFTWMNTTGSNLRSLKLSMLNRQCGIVVNENPWPKLYCQTSLTDLSLDYFGQMPCETLLSIANKLPNLTRFHLMCGFPWIVDTFSEIDSSIWRNLTSLTLKNLQSANESFFAFLFRLPNISYLDIGQVQCGDIIGSLSEKSSLNKLVLSGVQLKQKDLIKMVDNLPNLREISFRHLELSRYEIANFVEYYRLKGRSIRIPELSSEF